MRFLYLLISLSILIIQINGFAVNNYAMINDICTIRDRMRSTQLNLIKGEQTMPSRFEMEVDLPPKNSGLVAQISCEPVMNVPSRLVEVRYKLPFGLDVAPQGGLAVCTKENSGVSSNGNQEKPGDVLRYTSYFSMGLPRGDGLLSQGGAFAGALSWQCNLFDVLKAKAWQQVIDALTSNTKERTDEVVLIFERALPASN